MNTYKVFSIDPNTGKYFHDIETYEFNRVYIGKYACTPKYPLYTFDATSSRSMKQTPKIRIYTMIPVRNSWVEVVFESMLDPLEEHNLRNIFSKFIFFCEENIKNLDLSKLIEN
jgi:hypothetical protein